MSYYNHKFLLYIVFAFSVLLFHCDNTKSPSPSVTKKNSPKKNHIHSPIKKLKKLVRKSYSRSDSFLTVLERCVTPDSQLSFEKLANISINDTPIINRIENASGNDTTYIHLPSAPFLHALSERISHPRFTRLLRRINNSSESDRDLRTDIRRKLKMIKTLRQHPVLLSFLKNDCRLQHSDTSENEHVLYTLRDILLQSTTLEKKFSDRHSLRFWGECERTGITRTMETLLDSIALKYDPPIAVKLTGVPKYTNAPSVAHYFDTSSFSDPYVGIHSILDCRNELVEHYINDVVATMYGDTVTIDTSSLHQVLSKHSYYFNPYLRYYALQLDSLKHGTWDRISLKPSMTFIPQQHCDEFSLMIHLVPVASTSFETVLYTALPPDTATDKKVDPVGYFPLKSTITHFRKIEPSDTNPTFLQTTYSFMPPSCEKCIKEIHITGRYRLLHQRDRWNDTLRQIAHLRAITKNNDTLLIHEEKAYGTTVLHSAYIGNPILSDVNGDGRYDILIDVSNSGRILLLQREGYIFEPRKLRNNIVPENDGC